MLQPAVSVVVPARNEAATVAGVVRGVLAGGDARVVEVLVVDDGSTDGTAAVAAGAGAVVVAADATGRGKGQAMWKGVAECVGDVIVFCDADLDPFDPAYVRGLVDALVARPGAAMAKARYRSRTGTGGRVNELVARPILDLLHPALAHVAQPLGGEYAAWRGVLEQVPFVHGYGVDLGLLLDVAAGCGPTAIVEADLGDRSHRNRPLDELRPQARVVLEVAMHRAGLLDHPLPQCPPWRSVPGYVRRAASGASGSIGAGVGRPEFSGRAATSCTTPSSPRSG
ncbi:MAG TPA: glycosyltransferase [Acidimicrobiales bacterium]|nr:glycosyltransferase [Acidimicrobiales bacterium]